RSVPFSARPPQRPPLLPSTTLFRSGASDVEGFWRNLLDGVEGIRHFRPDEVDASVPDHLRRHPAFVAARGVIDDPDRFDAAFFGDRKSTRLNSSHVKISYAVFCLKK